MLDYDGGGSLDTDEFCEGVLRASTSEKPLELTRLVKQCSDILKLCRNMYVYQSSQKFDIGDLERKMKQLEKMESLQLDNAINARMEHGMEQIGRAHV